MNVLLVNTSTRGGAAKACIRLQAGLAKLGVQAPILCRDNIEEIENAKTIEIKEISYLDDLKRRALNYLSRKGIITTRRSHLINSTPSRIAGLEYFSLPMSDYDITTSRLYDDADIIHLHWVSDFLDWESFLKKNKKPVVWTFHDQSPFLGGEHYAERYYGIDKDGLPIPRVYSPSELYFRNQVISYKKDILNKVKKLTIVANSDWTKESAINSNLFEKFKIEKILCGFPTEIFCQQDPKLSKVKLGIPLDTVSLLFVADNISVKRKGFDYLILAINSLPIKYSAIISLIAIGSNEGYTFEDNSLIKLGRISDEKLLADIYTASDLFIIPSLEEAFGQTTVEALLCGTPCVGFPTGGITEVIEDGINGYLCSEISVESLKKSIIKYIDNRDKFDRSVIAQFAYEKYNLELSAKNYLSLYNQLI